MTDFLLELRSEEIPARMQAGARASLEKLFREQLTNAGVVPGAITVWSTPRRLALIARDLPEATEAISEEIKGPKTSAPAQALEGFLRKTGLTQDQLTERNGVWFAVSEKPGGATRDVLAEAIPAIVRAFPWPKSQRWGAASISTESLRWVRPLSGIVAILGEDLVACEIGGIASAYATLGHRFHHPGAITIGGAHDYQDKLRACHVIVDHAEREALIRDKAAAAAQAAGLTLVPDEGLVIENAGLTEWPVPLLGRFDAVFLEVPPEVIQLTARTNQKYFVCTRAPAQAGASGVDAQSTEAPASAGSQELANAFVCTANIEAHDAGAGIVHGNRKVLAARLADARFFWEQDRRKTLAEHAMALERITFHEKLGTVADKVERVAKLARWLVEEGIVKPSPLGRGLGEGPSSESLKTLTPTLSQRERGTSAPAQAELADLAEQAARLCKADLVTEMVGEFPELQGVMGGYYARAEGLPDAVADAIRDHYKPVGQGDAVPTAPVTVAVSLADKLDTVVGFFAIGEKPTGSKDPFALRRASLAIINLLQVNELRASLHDVFALARASLIRNLPANWIYLAAEDFENSISEIDEISRDDIAGISDEVLVLRSFEERNLNLGRTIYLNDVKGDVQKFYISSLFSVVLSCTNYIHDRVEEMCKRDGVDTGLVRALITKRLQVLTIDFGDFFGSACGPTRMTLREADLSTDDDLVRLLARVHALQAFVATPDGVNLLAGYKRAANILKKEDWQGVESEIPVTGEEDPLSNVDDPVLAPVIAAKMAERHENMLSYTPEPAEKALMDALDSARPRASAAVDAEDFAGAMAALATLRAPIDAFFDSVTVNDADPSKRRARLNLLARFRDAVHGVADFSKIEG